MEPRKIAVAYFSMEIGLEPTVPTYAGGLGVLAGDTLRAAADIGLPMAGITLLHRKGYFRQDLDSVGNQIESPSIWDPGAMLNEACVSASVQIEGRTVAVRAWRYDVTGSGRHPVPLYLLDTDLPVNAPEDRVLTDHLYGGDLKYRLSQEIVLGYGGIAVLRALGHPRVPTYHMNEGHSALLSLALIEERAGQRGFLGATAEDLERVRESCVFTTHTPVPAGHDQFPIELARQVLGRARSDAIERFGCCPEGVVNMTYHALHMSRYINGVSMRHEEVSQDMFPGYPINSIDNGVHAVTWVSDAFAGLFDRHIPQWRRDNQYLRYAIGLPLDEVRSAHSAAKGRLIEEVASRTGTRLDPGAFTIGFARRSTAYKRGGMLFEDIERLRQISGETGPVQVVYAGKAHPRDESGKALIRQVFEAARALGSAVPVAYLADYDMDLARVLCSGVDLWLNTPQKPQEASGTSGMKAALNGVPSLSVLDGWWVEGCVEGVTGWAIGDRVARVSDHVSETRSMYDKLQYVIVPTFYLRQGEFLEIMRSAISLNGSFFNAQRMLIQYIQNAYGQPTVLYPGLGSSAPALSEHTAYR